MTLLRFCFVSILIRITSASSGCIIGFDANSKPSDPRLLSGYNDVLGPIINLTYFDTALILSAKKLYPGTMRHPGGTGK